MTKFLADENFPRQAVDALRGMAIDIIAIADQHSGLADDNQSGDFGGLRLLIGGGQNTLDRRHDQLAPA